MITQEERIKLLEDAGMTSMLQKIKEEKEMKEQADKLTAMNFLATSEERIRSQICGKYWKFVFSGPDRFPMFLIPMLSTLVSMCAGIVVSLLVGTTGEYTNKIVASACVSGFIAGLLLWAFECWQTSELVSMPLSQWTDKIPTGALYAVKEAKEKGLCDFKIYYPVTAERARILKDPVIVGYFKSEEPKGQTINFSFTQRDYLLGGMLNTFGMQSEKRQMVEVFAWDDRKVYE